MQQRLDNRKAIKAISLLSESLDAVSESVNSLVRFPKSFGGLFRVDTLPARTGQIRLALNPSKRCLDLLVTLRTLERHLRAIQRTSHDGIPPNGNSISKH
jgi:hypothetical protein